MSQGGVNGLSNNFEKLKASFTSKVSILENYNRQLQSYLEFIALNPKCGLYYIEQYCENKNVLHFGINTIMTSEQAGLLKGIEESVFDESVAIAKSEEGRSEKSASQSKKSIKSQKSNKNGSVKSQADTNNNEENEKKVGIDVGANVPLHPLEILLMRKAIQSLDDSNKAVSVDIFERKDGVIQQDSLGRCKTHAIVLYLQKVGDKNQIIVIDPTNSDHSKHIDSDVNIVRIFGGKVSEEPQLKTASGLKIYNPAEDKKVGPKATEYLDCIDISVKIIRALNLLKDDDIAFNKLAELTVIQEITNKDFAKALIGEDEAKAKVDGRDLNARIRQATDDEVRHKINSLMVKIGDQIKYVRKYCVDGVTKAQSMEEKRLDFFREPYAPDDYEQGVNDLLRQYVEITKILFWLNLIIFIKMM